MVCEELPQTKLQCLHTVMKIVFYNLLLQSVTLALHQILDNIGPQVNLHDPTQRKKEKLNKELSKDRTYKNRIIGQYLLVGLSKDIFSFESLLLMFITKHQIDV